MVENHGEVSRSSEDVVGREKVGSAAGNCDSPTVPEQNSRRTSGGLRVDRQVIVQHSLQESFLRRAVSSETGVGKGCEQVLSIQRSLDPQFELTIWHLPQEAAPLLNSS